MTNNNWIRALETPMRTVKFSNDFSFLVAIQTQNI